MPPKYEPIRDTAERLGYSRETIRLWCKKGVIPGAKQFGGINGEWRVPTDLDPDTINQPAKRAPRRTVRRTAR